MNILSNNRIKSILLTVMCLCLVGCGGNKEEAALRQRAEEFGNLLIRIQGMTEADSKKALEEYIEPSENQADRIAKYYRDFSAGAKKFKIKSQSITKIVLNADKKSADVEFKTIAKLPNGRDLPVIQKTQWKLVAGKWYRCIGEAQKRLKP